MASPAPVFGVLIKVGLTETLAFINGFVYGPVTGFVTGSMIIVISDLFVLPGPWTPFIAAIIGLLGVCAGMIRKFPGSRLDFRLLASSAVALTLLSEFLQNTWVAFFYNIPVAAVMATGIPSMITALANNVFLFTTLGMKVIRQLQGTELELKAQ